STMAAPRFDAAMDRWSLQSSGQPSWTTMLVTSVPGPPGSWPLVYGMTSSSCSVEMFVYSMPGRYGPPPELSVSMNADPPSMSGIDSAAASSPGSAPKSIVNEPSVPDSPEKPPVPSQSGASET